MYAQTEQHNLLQKLTKNYKTFNANPLGLITKERPLRVNFSRIIVHIFVLMITLGFMKQQYHVIYIFIKSHYIHVQDL